jgi:glycosyltransferase involved in cell wall biosynthesis
LKKLRIASFASSHYYYPLPKGVVYAPIIMAKNINEGLEEKGHKITYFSPGDSKMNVSKIIGKYLEPLRQYKDHIVLSEKKDRPPDVDRISSLWDEYLIADMFEIAVKGKFDILHIHPIDRAIPFARIFKDIPVVYTLHDPISNWRKEIYKLFGTKNQHLVSISDSQRKPAPQLNYAGTIYNGIDTSLYSFSERGGENLIFSGRLSKDKGVAEAVKIAVKSNKKMTLLVPKPNGDEYFEKEVRPYLSDNIEIKPSQPEKSIASYYRKSKALLFPIQWEEPFGLVMTEAMASGTPVIAFARGSAPEVIEDGKTGFLINHSDGDKRGNYIIKKTGMAGMLEAVKRIYSMNLSEYNKMRYDCRRRVEDNFSLEKMINSYEDIFVKLARR